MFLKHFGLTSQPFGVTPDPKFLYRTAVHSEAWASLICSIENRVGFAALISEPGLGKTTLLFDILERCKSDARTAFLYFTQCSSQELMRQLANDLEVPCRDDDVIKMLGNFKDYLLRGSRPTVIVIDEAHNLDETALETVRLLSDFELPHRKLLHFILSGQTRLADTLAKPASIQLLQRVMTVCRLLPLSVPQTKEYISHRLAVAGYVGGPIFSPCAIEEICEISRGVPRVVNQICFNAMMLAYASGETRVGKEEILEVRQDLSLAYETRPTKTQIPSETKSQSKSHAFSEFHSQRIGDATYAASAVGAPFDERRGIRAAVGGSEGPRPLAPEGDYGSQPQPAPSHRPKPGEHPLQHPHSSDQTAYPSAGPTLLRERDPSGEGQIPKTHRTVAEFEPPSLLRELRPQLLLLVATVIGVGALLVSAWFSPPDPSMASGEPSEAIANRATQSSKVLAVGARPVAGESLESSGRRARPMIVQTDAANLALRKRASVALAPTRDDVPEELAPKIQPQVDHAALHRLAPDARPAALAPPQSRHQQLHPIQVVKPEYPQAAKNARLEGDVVLAASVDPKGSVQHVSVISGNPLLARAAVVALRKWKYKSSPPESGPQNSETLVRMRFSLDRVD